MDDDFSAKDKIKNGKPGFEASHGPPILMFIATDQKLEYSMHILSSF